MKARLLCTTGLLAGTQFEISSEATVGKNAGNTIVLDSPIISGWHARIFFDADQQCYFLQDLRSRNGTKLDGMRVYGKEKLGDLHVVTFAGHFDFIFQRLEGTRQAGAQTPPPPLDSELAAGNVAAKNGKPQREFIVQADKLPRQERAASFASGAEAVPPSAGSKTMIGEVIIPLPNFQWTEEPPASNLRRRQTDFQLRIDNASKQTQFFLLKDGENLIGRDPACDVCIDDASISRRHAVLIVQSGKVIVRDLHSRNHTFVGQQIIASEMEIKRDTSLRFGSVEARLI
ncbi:MAG: FHA domain-containing protein [candidate division KSB1 bacterium]|nr:FHA domain-containing protein [candidate division KSB1 bacterium]